MCHYIAPELRQQKEYFAAMDVRPWPWPITSINKCTHGKWRKPRNGLTWFNIIWISIFQYCFVRVATTIIATTTQYTGHYCEDSLHPAFAHFWMMFFNCLSVTLAIYMLITFYLNLKTVLAPKEPLLKLLCIKLVVFFCFWQMILLDFLSSAKIIKPTNKISPGDISVGFNALLVCFEMVIFSIMHLFAFPWKVYESPAIRPGPVPSQTPKTQAWRALMYAFSPFDIVKAFARGMKWAVFGYRRRHQEADSVMARKNLKKDSEEGQGLVSNAGLPGNWPNPGAYGQPANPGVYGQLANPGGLVVQHPSPSDQEPVPQQEEVPIYGLATTEHTGYRPPAMEITTTPAEGPNIRNHPAFSPVGPLANRRDGAPNALPYPTDTSISSIHGYPQPHGTPSPSEDHELLRQHPALRNPSWQPHQHPALQGVGFTYSESARDEDGVYQGPSPRRRVEEGVEEEQGGVRWREV